MRLRLADKRKRCAKLLEGAEPSVAMKSSRSSRSRDKAFLMQLAEMMEASGSKQMKMLQLAEPEPELMPYSDWEKKQQALSRRLPNLSDGRTKDRLHEQILRSGDHIMQSYASSNASTTRNSGTRTRSDFSEQEDPERMSAVTSEHEQRMYEELKLANSRLQQQYDRDVADLKRDFDRRLKQVVLAKDTMCEEKLNELRTNLTKEHERNIARLEEEVTRNVMLRCRNEDKTQLRKHLQDEFELQHAKEMQAAIAAERSRLEKQLRQRLAQQERAAEEKMDATVRQINARHEAKYAALVKMFSDLYERHVELLSSSEEIETDFRQLQTDYQRFMNYTEGMFHSDFMMKLRTHGLDLSQKRNESRNKDYLIEMQSFYQRLSQSQSTSG